MLLPQLAGNTPQGTGSLSTSSSPEVRNGRLGTNSFDHLPNIWQNGMGIYQTPALPPNFVPTPPSEDHPILSKSMSHPGVMQHGIGTKGGVIRSSPPALGSRQPPKALSTPDLYAILYKKYNP